MDFVRLPLLGINEDTVFANIIAYKNAIQITIEKFSHYGALNLGCEDISKEDFLLEYRKIDEWNRDITITNNAICKFSVK